MKKTTVIIDTDPGIDDAVAIALAVQSKKLNIQLISTMFGNVTASQTAINALRLLDLFGAKIPVAKGADRPLSAGQEPVHVHGSDGLGELPFEADKYTADNLAQFAATGAIEETYRNILETVDAATFICIGPMTNFASFVKKYPDLARQKITEFVFMGGSLDPNPVADGDYQIPYAEFNINIDPEAVRTVFSSGIPLTMIPMELGHTAYLTPAEVAKGAAVSPVGSAFRDIFPNYRDRHVAQPNIATHDMCAICYLTDPKLLEIRSAHISVITDKQNQSAVNVDFRATPNASVAVSIDIPKLRKLYLSMLKFYK
jgi:non-specific riboncleoside hydrolase